MATRWSTSLALVVSRFAGQHSVFVSLCWSQLASLLDRLEQPGTTTTSCLCGSFIYFLLVIRCQSNTGRCRFNANCAVSWCMWSFCQSGVISWTFCTFVHVFCQRMSCSAGPTWALDGTTVSSRASNGVKDVDHRPRRRKGPITHPLSALDLPLVHQTEPRNRYTAQIVEFRVHWGHMTTTEQTIWWWRLWDATESSRKS